MNKKTRSIRYIQNSIYFDVSKFGISLPGTSIFRFHVLTCDIVHISQFDVAIKSKNSIKYDIHYNIRRRHHQRRTHVPPTAATADLLAGPPLTEQRAKAETDIIGKGNNARRKRRIIYNQNGFLHACYGRPIFGVWCQLSRFSCVTDVFCLVYFVGLVSCVPQPTPAAIDRRQPGCGCTASLCCTLLHFCVVPSCVVSRCVVMCRAVHHANNEAADTGGTERRLYVNTRSCIIQVRRCNRQ